MDLEQRYSRLQYPRIWSRIDDYYDIPPGIVHYNNPDKELTDMASIRLQSRIRGNLLRKKRLNDAQKRLELSKYLHERLGVESIMRNLPEDIVTNIVEQHGKGRSKSKDKRKKTKKRKMKGGTNSSELSNQQEQFDEFLSGIYPEWKDEPIVSNTNDYYSTLLKHATNLPYDLQDTIGIERDILIKKKKENIKDIRNERIWSFKFIFIYNNI